MGVPALFSPARKRRQARRPPVRTAPRDAAAAAVGVGGCSLGAGGPGKWAEAGSRPSTQRGAGRERLLRKYPEGRKRAAESARSRATLVHRTGERGNEKRSLFWCKKY